MGHALERVRLYALERFGLYEFSRDGTLSIGWFLQKLQQAVPAVNQIMMINFSRGAAIFLAAYFVGLTAYAQNKTLWKSVEFAIVKFDDGPPKSWNMYHAEKHGVLLLRIWKRYLLIDLNQQEVYDIDPATVKAKTDAVEWSTADKPSAPLDITEWKERNVGSMDRLRFRLPKAGPVLELQIPLRPDGKTVY